ncbi:hypothetical protein DW881_02955 [Exiguobacterium sp. AM39-5BH]|nr:hypothetical protein DW881_02955 [Exiguobacterium sp. AM39-5BH]
MLFRVTLSKIECVFMKIKHNLYVNAYIDCVHDEANALCKISRDEDWSSTSLSVVYNEERT